MLFSTTLLVLCYLLLRPTESFLSTLLALFRDNPAWPSIPDSFAWAWQPWDCMNGFLFQGSWTSYLPYTSCSFPWLLKAGHRKQNFFSMKQIRRLKVQLLLTWINTKIEQLSCYVPVGSTYCLMEPEIVLSSGIRDPSVFVLSSLVIKETTLV